MTMTHKLPTPRIGARAGVVAALLALAAAPAFAQEAAQSEVPDPGWVKLCNTNPENNQEICVITRERRAQTGQLLAAVSVREAGDKKILVTAVPPGMLIKPGLQVQIDGANEQKAAYSICFPNMCFAEAEINQAYIDSMKRGSQVVVTSLNQQGRPVNFDLSLSGFTASYDGAATDPAQFQAQQQKLQEELARKAAAARQQLVEGQQQQRGEPAQQQ